MSNLNLKTTEGKSRGRLLEHWNNKRYRHGRRLRNLQRSLESAILSTEPAALHGSRICLVKLKQFVKGSLEAFIDLNRNR